MKLLSRSLLCLAPLLALGGPDAAAVEVPLSVKEPAGIERKSQPAVGGVSFSPGEVKDAKDLVLCDAAGKPVPAQLTVLAKHADGSVQWVLVDVLGDVAAGGESKYVLKTGGGNPAPPHPLKIEESGAVVTVDTGAVRFTVSKTGFGLFQAAEVAGKQAAKDGTVEARTVEVEGKKIDKRGRNTAHFRKEGGKTFNLKAGKPRRVKWEYRGPVRATLRVDGDYTSDGGVPLSYTARITAWAGLGCVRVRFALRNSNPAAGADAFVPRAWISLPLAFEAASQGSGLDWAAGGDGQVGLLVQNRHTAGIYRGPGTYLRGKFGCGASKGWKGLYKQEVAGKSALVEIVSAGPTTKSQAGALGFNQEGIFALADRSHKESEIWFDFYAGTREAAENEKRAKSFRSKLLILASGEHYSRTEGLAVGHFGTLADEVATYRIWGWKGAEDKGKYPKLAHDPFAFVFKEWVHDVSEDDCVEGYLLQFLRTGDRGFFDWAEAWAGLYRGHSITRTDWGERWGVPAPSGKRESTGLGFGWYGPHVYEWADSRQHGCHHYGRGIFDIYFLTGDVDCLEAGLDLAEEQPEAYLKYKPGKGFAFKRSFGRAFLTAISAWRATRDDRWKKTCDHMAAMILQGTNWDPKLSIYRQGLGIKNSYFARAWTKGHFDLSTVKNWKLRDIPPKLETFLTENGVNAWYNRGKIMAKNKAGEQWEVTYLTQVFELSACHLAMERYARLSGSEPMKKRLVEVSEGVRRHWWSGRVQHMIGSPYFGWPRKDKVLDPYEWAGPNPKISGYATRYTADMFARAYSFTGEEKWILLAKRSWNRGSKRLYQRTEQCAADDEVGPFAYIRGAHNNTMSECSVRLFYEVPRAKDVDWNKKP
ncbi:MAG: exo-rhamnogalacturonan lyase family protein [Planctomycetota bacterium]